MDVVLRVRHDHLAQEFLCASTELRLVHTSQGSDWPRTIEAFCCDRRAERFGSQLSDFETCCAPCRFLSISPKNAEDETSRPDAPGVDEVRESA